MNKRGSEINLPEVPEHINGKALVISRFPTWTPASLPWALGKYSPKSRWGRMKTDAGNGYGSSIPVLRGWWAQGGGRDTHHLIGWMREALALGFRSCAYWRVAEKCLRLLSYKFKTFKITKMSFFNLFVIIWMQPRVVSKEKKLHCLSAMWCSMSSTAVWNECFWVTYWLHYCSYDCWHILFFEFHTNWIVPCGRMGETEIPSE